MDRTTQEQIDEWTNEFGTYSEQTKKTVNTAYMSPLFNREWSGRRFALVNMKTTVESQYFYSIKEDGMAGNEANTVNEGYDYELWGNGDYSLYIMNGTLTASISNGNVNFTNALLTVSNANIYTDMLSWMTDDGMSIKNGSNVTLNGSSCWFEKLFMDKDCVFSVKNGDGVGNYVHFADGSYYVRYSETKNYYASPAVKVVVEKGKVPASNEPTTGDVTTEVPTTEKPTAEEPTTGAATTEEQTTGEQTTEAVSTEKQTTEGTTDAASTAQTTTEGSKTTAAAPNTGDDSNVAWLMMLMAVCLLGAAGVVAYKKER